MHEIGRTEDAYDHRHDRDEGQRDDLPETPGGILLGRIRWDVSNGKLLFRGRRGF